jgi:hypothetical protein
MNPRIQELAEQAHCYACEYARRPDYSPHNPYNESMYKRRYDSKFAELIVKECAQAFEAEVDTWKEMDPYQGSIKRQGTKAIKQHFGVEE